MRTDKHDARGIAQLLRLGWFRPVHVKTLLAQASLYIGYTRQVGERIPTRLRHRWSLELGPSAIVLPRLMKACLPSTCSSTISAANYDNQTTEYRIALKHTAPAGILISDMLNDAFAELGEATGCPWVVIQQSKAPPIGVLSKASR